MGAGMSKMSVDAFQMIADWLPSVTEERKQFQILAAVSKEDSCPLTVVWRNDSDAVPLLTTGRHPKTDGLPKVTKGGKVAAVATVIHDMFCPTVEAVAKMLALGRARTVWLNTAISRTV